MLVQCDSGNIKTIVDNFNEIHIIDIVIAPIKLCKDILIILGWQLINGTNLFNEFHTL